MGVGLDTHYDGKEQRPTKEKGIRTHVANQKLTLFVEKSVRRQEDDCTKNSHVVQMIGSWDRSQLSGASCKK